jgi:dipeptidyl aminopeptidase/acylaminoacyl peptidase
MSNPTRPTIAPFGTWTSPITAEAVAAAAVRLGAVAVHEEEIYWLEGRPAEGGRGVVVKRARDGRISDVTPAGTNVRSRVHEYGGGAYAVSGGTVFYSEFVDQRVYRLAPGSKPEPITPSGDRFYADFSVDRPRGRIICVCEDHTLTGQEAITTLVSIPLDGAPSAGEVVRSGDDFYAAPRLSPDGSQLSWIAWNHPQMPWDGTELWLARIAGDGTLENPRCVAGGTGESIFQPGWSPDGTLYFVSDRTGWWNLYCLAGDAVKPVYAMAAEFGRPLWQLSASTWASADAARLVTTYAQAGRWRLGTLDVSTRALVPLAPDIEPADTIAATPTHAVLVAGSALAPDAVVRVDLRTGEVETLRAASTTGIDPALLSQPQPIEFPTEDALTAHAFYYAPRNPRFTAPAGDRPPLLVISHGGPTSATSGRLNVEVQFWTSRGFALVDVNYGGSAGYGRAYRQRLRGRWGVVDVDDCVNAAKCLTDRGLVDPNRLVIRGRSAGGYTTLAALTFRPEIFAAGGSYYGIGELELLARDTHKFESRYLDSLIGPYPEARDTYRARSPINHVGALSCPIIFFQGLEDRVVPPDQARTMSGAVRDKGLPVALLMFEGEQHGFRRVAAIARCLEAELFFYGAVFGFTPAGVRPSLQIDNIEKWRVKSASSAQPL